MKHRIISLCLSFSILLSLMPAAYATSGHTYYSQKNLTYNGTNLSSMCYCCCIAMSLTDIGILTTPVDVYINNGNTAYCKAFSTIANDFGATWTNKDVRNWDASKKQAELKKTLSTGNYPQGILVYGGGHMILARKVVGDIVYFDDPVRGCCLSIENCYNVSWNNITYWGYFTKGISTSNSSNSSNIELPKLTIASNVSGKWTITIPANYKLVCYDSANATKSSIYYIAAKTAPYTLTCTQKATLSNGKTRYFFTSGDNKNLWFDYTSGMSSSTDVKSYTVTFDPNGGSVWPASKTLTMGTRLTGMPSPTRDGYRFVGWAMDKIDPDGSGVSVTTIVADGVWTFDEDTTLYAHWAKETPTDPPQNTPPDIVKPTSFDYSGKFGVNNALTWGLNIETGILVLSGNGRMKDWSNAEYRPWAKVRNSITGVLIEDGIQNISGATLCRLENMTNASIPESVTELGNNAFLSSYSLEGIELPSGLIKIDGSAFCDCTALKSITIPKNVSYIGDWTFRGCYNLKSVYFCGNAPSYFGSNATEYYTGPHASQNVFRGCTNLTAYYPANSSGWDSIIKEYTNVTWKTWDPGDTGSSGGSSGGPNVATWGAWSAWSSTPYSASSTREVETRQVKVSDAYTEYRYGLWRNDDNAGWCPNYGAQFSSSNSSWYEAYTSWSKTRMYQNTGHKAYCDGSNHNHTHVSGYDSSGRANWDIYSDDGTFTGWGRLYYYWEETRTIPAVYETQYRYRDLISA